MLSAKCYQQNDTSKMPPSDKPSLMVAFIIKYSYRSNML